MKHYSIDLSMDYQQEALAEANSVDIHCGDLSQCPVELLERVIKLLPSNLDALDLSNCRLGKLSEDLLMKLLMMLPKGLRSLDVSKNDLDALEPDALLKFIISVPKDLQELDLSGLTFKSCNAGQIEAILLSLPSRLKQFDTHLIDFNRFSLQDIKKIIKALPQAQTTLDLTGYDWSRFSDEELLDLMNSMPKRFDLLKWSRKDLPHQDSDETLLKLFMKVGFHINQIKVDYRTIQPNELRKARVSKELDRLHESSKEKNLLLVCLGILEPSDNKIAALDYLIRVLDSKKEDALSQWKEFYGPVVTAQRNRLHAFFNPKHRSKTQTVVDDILEPFLNKITPQVLK